MMKLNHSAKGRRVFLTIIYMVIFLFSIYAILQTRYFVFKGEIDESTGQFVFLFLKTPEIRQHEFVMLKVSLFAITAMLSFVLMLSNYFFHSKPSLEKVLTGKMDKEIKAMLKEEKKKHS